MTVPEIRNEPCQCPPGECEAGATPESCINRLTGEVRVLLCAACSSHTWHHNGKCCRCKSMLSDARDKQRQQQNQILVDRINRMLFDRIKGVPALPSSSEESNADPKNPNANGQLPGD